MTINATNLFPPGFLWGCATAAHQVEGSNANNWWRWEHTPGRIFQGGRAGDACGWIAGRYVEDFDRAAEMRNNAQRISIEWSRIEPEPGQWDSWALDFYRTMLKALHARGMQPMVTLHHFTEPLWVADHDGWLWDETPQCFARFAAKAVEALGDLCNLWCTINEPMVYATNGYLFGAWPPGMRSRRATARVALNMLRGHAAAYHAMKAVQPAAQVGLAKHVIGIKPWAPAWLNRPAARLIDRFFNESFLLALKTGTARFPGMRAVATPEVRGTLDWIGLQYYQEFRGGFSLGAPRSLFVAQRKPEDMPVGPHTWGGLNPGAIFDRIRWLWELLGVPIYITESGVPDPDDAIRPAYLAETVQSVWKAVGYNFPVRGFFFWSLVDNFEWTEGYDPRYRFGLYGVDFATQARTARPSAHFYRDICARNGLAAESVAQYAPGVLAKLFPGGPGQTDVKLKPPRPVGG
jgi:beta-glucosidase